LVVSSRRVDNLDHAFQGLRHFRWKKKAKNILMKGTGNDQEQNSIFHFFQPMDNSVARRCGCRFGFDRNLGIAATKSGE
jgi:hypothetical protein